jgi:hypothetical protein
MAESTQTASPVVRRLLEIAVGALLGFAVCSVGGPSLIAWWYEPPSQDAFSCAGSVRTALTQFVTLQLVFAGTGGIGLSILLFFGRRALKKRAAGTGSA